MGKKEKLLIAKMRVRAFVADKYKMRIGGDTYAKIDEALKAILAFAVDSVNNRKAKMMMARDITIPEKREEAEEKEEAEETEETEETTDETSEENKTDTDATEEKAEEKAESSEEKKQEKE